MADPVTLLTGGTLISTAVGGLFGTKGAAETAGAQAQMYTYQAAVAQVNQQIAENNANYAMAVGEVKAQQEGMKTRALIGTTRAAQGASGININSKSSTDVRASEAELGAADAMTIRSNAGKEAYNERVQAMNLGAQSEIYKRSAASSIRAGDIAQTTSLLGTATSVSDKWLKFSSAGVFGKTASGIVS